MKSSRLESGLVLVLAAVIFAASGQAPEKNAAATAGVQAEKSLVRKDLLSSDGPDAPLPLRDIFRPKITSVSHVFLSRPVMQKPGAAAPEAAPAFALSLTYVGPIASVGKILAMVTVGGQTVPVSVGEEVSPGYKVLRISSDSIDIEGPNGQVKTFTR